MGYCYEATPISISIPTKFVESRYRPGGVRSRDERNAGPRFRLKDTSACLSTHFFGLTLFLAASLSFLVQPMVAKTVLPYFGGSPAIWTVCMLFFQTMLLLGYA